MTTSRPEPYRLGLGSIEERPWQERPSPTPKRSPPMCRWQPTVQHLSAGPASLDAHRSSPIQRDLRPGRSARDVYEMEEASPWTNHPTAVTSSYPQALYGASWSARGVGLALFRASPRAFHKGRYAVLLSIPAAFMMNAKTTGCPPSTGR